MRPSAKVRAAQRERRGSAAIVAPSSLRLPDGPPEVRRSPPAQRPLRPPRAVDREARQLSLVAALGEAPKQGGEGVETSVTGEAGGLGAHGLLHRGELLDAEVKVEGGLTAQEVVTQEHRRDGVRPAAVVVRRVPIDDEPQARASEQARRGPRVFVGAHHPSRALSWGREAEGGGEVIIQRERCVCDQGRHRLIFGDDPRHQGQGREARGLLLGLAERLVTAQGGALEVERGVKAIVPGPGRAVCEAGVIDEAQDQGLGGVRGRRRRRRAPRLKAARRAGPETPV
jgi:hypothetical protein